MGVYDLSYALPTANMLNPNNVAAANYAQMPQVAAPTSLAPAASTNLGAPATNTPQTDAQTGLGMNIGTGQLALGAIGTIGNLWAAFQAQKMAKEQFNFQKGITNANFANQIQSYNTTLADKINSRIAQENGTAQEAKNYIDKNQLVDRRKNQ